MSYLNNFRLFCEIIFDVFAPAFLVKGSLEEANTM